METSPAAEVSSNAGTETVVVNGGDTTQAQQHTSPLVTDDISSSYSSSSSLSSVMKNTWLNTSESPLSPAQAMSGAMSTATTDKTSLPPALEPMTRPLRLLDLPVDILKDIVKEVTHTNDLTSLALCHSALHRLVIPHIYSRFDIVWPESVTPTEPRTGVDALTYGLATLVMAEDVFGEGASQCLFKMGSSEHSAPDTVATSSNLTTSKHALDTNARRRRGNYYAHFTRKFSLGNGPPEWVQEYLISKEGGKMLGTLVALAVARMRNLETFVWDMPTGILRDVWIALSSLDDRSDGLPCRLERVAVRFHDNSPEPHALPLHHPSPPDSAHPPLEHVEHPSFSVLPPLKTISVLDVDELQYLDELSLLVGRSQHKLRELRLGVARHLDRDWTTVWDGDQLHQVDKDHPTAGSVTIGEKRLGGVLGVLTAWVSDMRRTYSLPQRPKRLRRRSNATIATAAAANIANIPASHVDSQDTAAAADGVVPDIHPPLVPSGMPAAMGTESQPSQKSPFLGLHHPIDSLVHTTQQSPSGPAHVEATPPANNVTPVEEDDPRLSGKLSLDVLELERVPLSIPVLQNVIDWGVLTSLTLLQCANHDHLWKTLRRLYTPVGSNPRHYATSDPAKSKQRAPKAPISLSDYKLKLTKIHTDTVTPALITFIKETLAPNTLEVVFLQESCSNNTIVSVDSIFRGVLRKHKGSLKKVLIDSSERGVEGQPIANSRSKRWMLTRKMLEFMTSGKMPRLRELGAALDYRDWHFFLQHLPYIPHLRSLYIPYMTNYVHGNFMAEPRELALQIVDIVALRPDIELCYLGIAKKCFEILENARGKDADGSTASNTTAGEDEDEDGDEDDEDDDDEMAEEDDDDDHSQNSSTASTEPADSDSEDESGTGDRTRRGRDVQLSLREILYYDDKVTIFRARHGKL